MKNKLVHFLRYINKFGLFRAIVYFKKLQYSKRKIVEFYILPQYKIRLRPKTSDIYAFDLIFLWDEYDVNKYLKKADYIIDLGANIGLATLFYSIQYPNAKIISIEPEENNYKILSSNTSFSDNIFPINKAIWSSETYIGLARNITNNNDGFVYDITNNNNVPTITIDKIMKDFNIEVIDILKIDIEGAEKELFSTNYSNWLGKVKILIIELHDLNNKGASKSFFKAILNYDFSIVFENKESLICLNNNFLTI